MTLAQLLARVDDTRDELIALLRNLVTFPTVNTGVPPTGHETPCAEYLRALLEHEGVVAEVIETAPGRGNLLARRPGTGGGPTLLLMGHLDVVPAGDESRWTHPPFAGDIADGWLYGRGSNDCKGLVAAEVHALRLLARYRVPLAGEIKLAACADEETGGAFGFGAIARDYPDRLRADLALNEGGGSPVRLPDQRAGWFVATGEKGRLEATIHLTGRSEHASLPWLADNPLLRLADVLQRLERYQPEVRVTPAAASLWEALTGSPAPAAGAFDEALRRLAERFPGQYARLLALTRMSWVPTIVRAGQKSNAIPDSAEIVVDIRTLPEQDAATATRELERLLADVPGARVTVSVTAESCATAWTDTWRDLLTEALAEAGSPDAVLLPTLCSGFTDSRLVRPLGTPTLGFAPVPADTDLERCGCHNIDEQFPLEGLVYRTKFLLAVAWRFCGGP